MFDFFENHLHIKGPQLIPFRYFYMSLATYFFNNRKPNYEFLKKYFWYNSFHNSDLLANTTQLHQHINYLIEEKEEKSTDFERFLIDKNKLRTSSYSSRGRLSRAILSLFANQEPLDWAYTDRRVLSDVYYLLTDKPNLHHIFPSNYIQSNRGKNKLDSNSLMNIAYLTQLTNIKISDKNPMVYLREYDNPEFQKILGTHLIPSEILEWARMEKIPDNALDVFIEKRINIIISKLKEKIKESSFEIIDTSESSSDLA
jgi:hypothetical protein